MSKNPLFKAFSLLLFVLLTSNFSIILLAQTNTNLALKNNTDAKAVYCFNGVVQTTINPRSNANVSLPTGAQKIDLVLIKPTETVISCTYDFASTDQAGLPTHDEYADTFFDYEDYTYTATQTSKPVTTNTTTYSITTNTASPGITGVDLSGINSNVDEFSNTQLCVDGSILTAPTANLIPLTVGSHQLNLISTKTPTCSATSSTPQTSIEIDKIYKYTPIITTKIVDMPAYQFVAEFMAKQVVQQTPLVGGTASNVTPESTNQAPQSTQNTDKKTTLKEETKPNNTDVVAMSTQPNPIKYDKLKIDRVSENSIGGDTGNTKLVDTKPFLQSTTSVQKNTIDWNFMGILSTIGWFVIDIIYFIYRKKQEFGLIHIGV